MAECKNCKADPLQDSRRVLMRINPKGVTGEWVCDVCLKERLELFEDKPHYLHSATCPNYCDYACNGQRGFDLAHQIDTYLERPNADVSDPRRA